LTQPEIIARELERLRRADPTAENLHAVDRALADVARQQRNLVDQLAQLGSDVAEVVGEKLTALGAQRRQLEAERERGQRQRGDWETAQARLGELTAWCQNVATNLSALTYDQKRLALTALGARVRVWPADHTPRYELELSVPLGGAIAGRSTSGT